MKHEQTWYYARDDKVHGPVLLEELAHRLPEAGGESTLVYGPGLVDWIEARHVPEVVALLRGEPQAPPLPGRRRSDEIDYEIFGDETQYIEIVLDPGEQVVAEAGAMMYMNDGIEMRTVLGDPAHADGGLFDKLYSAGRRKITGESMFVTTFTNADTRRRRVAFAAPFPGKLVPMHLDELGGELVCQKDSFICAARGTHLGIAFQKRFGVGLFGGEGFVMQRLVGDGVAIIHAGGTLMHRRLEPDERLRIDTGCLVALSPDVHFDVEFVQGVKNSLFGGEGLFFATLTGPGQVWCQSLPFSRLAGRMLWATPVFGGNRGEGSILRPLG